MPARDESDGVIELTISPGAHDEQADQTAPPRPWYQWLRQRKLVLLAIVVVGISGLVGYHFLQSPSPEDIAREYMEAVHAGDVDQALEFVDLDSSVVRDDLLVPEAISEEWDIQEVETVSEREDLGVATVRVAISTTDGQEENGDLSFTLNDDGEWEMTNGLAHLDVTGGSLMYVEANGHHAPLEESERAIFALFPGTYEFFETQPGDISVRAVSALAVADRYKNVQQRVSQDDPELGPDLMWEMSIVSEVQPRFDEFLDECAEIGEVNREGCPFGGSLDRHGVTHQSPVDWEIVEYPTIDLAHEEGNTGKVVIDLHWDRDSEGLVRGTVETDDGPIVLECGVDTSTIELAVRSDGELLIAPFDVPDREREEASRISEAWCEEA